MAREDWLAGVGVETEAECLFAQSVESKVGWKGCGRSIARK
jgi:hypothetical protein